MISELTADTAAYSLYRDPIKTSRYEGTGTPEEIIGGPYKLGDTKPSYISPTTDEPSIGLHLPTDELEEERADLSVDDLDASDVDPDLVEIEEAQADLLDEDLDVTETVPSLDEDSEEIVQKEFEESLLDNTLHFSRDSKGTESKSIAYRQSGWTDLRYQADLVEVLFNNTPERRNHYWCSYSNDHD